MCSSGFIKQWYSNLQKILFLLAVFIIVSIYNLSNAQDIGLKLPHDTKQPMTITADQLYYDKGRDILHGAGNVVIEQGSQIVVADEVSYLRSSDEIHANGNIAFKRDDTSIYFGEKLKFNQALNKGLIISFKGRFKENSVIAAQHAEMVNEEVMLLDHMVYSPCRICADNFVANQPLWQVRTARSTLDRREERIEHKDAVLEAFGVPVLYVPYLSTPAPGARRRSGFLVPTLSFSSVLGQGLYIPYYWNIAPNMDATFGINFHPKNSVHTVYEGEFRHKIKHGSYKISGSFNYGEKLRRDGSAIPNKHMWRGHYNFQGNYEVQSSKLPGILTIDSKGVKDASRTYLKEYKLLNDDVLRTDVHFREVDEEDYYSARSLYFQDLRPTSHYKTTAISMPSITYIKKHQLASIPVRADLLLNYTNLMRKQGMRYHRLVGETGLGTTMVTRMGTILESKVSLRTDLYHISFKPITVQSDYMYTSKNKNSNILRFQPELRNTLHMPLYGSYRQSLVTIDPMLQFIASPTQRHLNKVENEDSQAPEISAFNLFSSNRYRGYDRFEVGNRLNYGFMASITNAYMRELSLIVGHAYHFHKDSNFNKSSGMGSKFSDYVFSTTIRPTDRWLITNSLRLDRAKGTVNRSELGVSYNAPTIRMALNYFSIGNKLVSGSSTEISKQELIITPGYNLYREWWIDIGIHTRLGKKVPGTSSNIVTNKISLQNFNECLRTEFTIMRDYTKMKNLRPETTYLVSITVPSF